MANTNKNTKLDAHVETIRHEIYETTNYSCVPMNQRRKAEALACKRIYDKFYRENKKKEIKKRERLNNVYF